jgi:hypothetical protein
MTQERLYPCPHRGRGDKKRITMNRKSKLKIIGINLLLFALIFGLVSLNKNIFRPTLNHLPFFGILTGCLPNFLAAYIISLAFVNAVLIRKPKYARLFIFMSSFLVFVILTIEELKPMWGASTHYDSYDILASGIGSLLSILTFELITLKRKKQNKEN